MAKCFIFTIGRCSEYDTRNVFVLVIHASTFGNLLQQYYYYPSCKRLLNEIIKSRWIQYTDWLLLPRRDFTAGYQLQSWTLCYNLADERGQKSLDGPCTSVWLTFELRCEIIIVTKPFPEYLLILFYFISINCSLVSWAESSGPNKCKS